MNPGARVPTPYVLSFSSRGVTWLLSGTVLALIAIHIGFQYDRFYTHRLPWELHALFDLDEEASVPTWYSTAALGFAALLLAGIARARARAGSTESRWWGGMAWITLYLSADEVAGVHETVNSLSPISWTVPFGLLALAVAAAYFPFVWRQAPETRRGIIAFGIVYVTGAAGVELLTSQFFDESNKRQFLYALNTPIEEGLEMFGVIILIRTLLRLMERESSGAAAVAIEAPAAPEGRASPPAARDAARGVAQ